jgi:hypothetical protein
MMGAKEVHLLGYDENRLTVDSETDAVATIDYPHHERHEGKSWCAGGTAVLGNNALDMVTIQTSNTRAHLLISAKGTAAGNVALYETVVSTGSAAKTMFNHDRNSARAPKITTQVTSILTTTGTAIWQDRFGAGQIAGGSTRTEGETILKTDTKYALVIQSNAASNGTAWFLDWYEK